MFGRDDQTDAYDTVAGDDTAGTKAAMAHLLGLGHTKITHLTLNESNELEILPHGVRLREYRSAMRAAGLDDFVMRTDEGQDAAYRAVRDAIDQGWDTTAILAIGALRAVAETGTRLSVVGYDDVPIAAHPAIGLTTVHQPGGAMGARAVELLLDRLAGRTEAVHEIFEPELRVRTSTRPPG
jgi:LacI family transcriptional regulator